MWEIIIVSLSTSLGVFLIALYFRIISSIIMRIFNKIKNAFNKAKRRNTDNGLEP